MVGQVTGVLGDTVAKLTFDDDFQGKRQQQKAGSVGQGLEGAAKVGQSCRLFGRWFYHYTCTHAENAFLYRYINIIY